MNEKVISFKPEFNLRIAEIVRLQHAVSNLIYELLLISWDKIVNHMCNREIENNRDYVERQTKEETEWSKETSVVKQIAR